MLKEQYAEKEELDKEFKARMLAGEIAYLNSKLELTTEEEARIELQTKILDTQKEYNQAVRDATIPLLEAKEATGGINDAQLETGRILDINTEKFQKNKTEIEKYNQQQQALAGNILSVSGIVADGVFDMATNSEDALKEMGKRLLLFALEQLKIQAQLAAAGATAQSLAQPDSVATFGATGLVRAAIIVGLIEAAFAGLEGMVNSFSVGGFTGGNQKYKPAGIVHEEEFVANQDAVRNPTVRPVLNLLDAYQKSGQIASVNFSSVLPIIKKEKQLFTGGFTSNVTPTATNSNNAISSQHPTFEETAEMVVRGVQAGRGQAMLFEDKLENTLMKLSSSADKLAEKEVSISMSELKSKSKQHSDMHNSVNMKKE